MRLVSALYWIAIVLTAPVFFLGAVLVFCLTAWWDRRRVVLHQYSCLWAMVFVWANPLWSLEVTGRERLPWRGPAVLAANHASLIDILVLFGLFRPYKWVSKAENFRVPFIGWNMRLNGYVPLVRGDRASVLEMLERCRRLLRRGSAVLIFPEGTRSKDGALRPFKDGAFQLAVEQGVPLIPIAVHGTGEALQTKTLVLREHVRAHVEVLEPLDPAAFASVEALRDETRRLIEEAQARRAAQPVT